MTDTITSFTSRKLRHAHWLSRLKTLLCFFVEKTSATVNYGASRERLFKSALCTAWNVNIAGNYLKISGQIHTFTSALALESYCSSTRRCRRLPRVLRPPFADDVTRRKLRGEKKGRRVMKIKVHCHAVHIRLNSWLRFGNTFAFWEHASINRQPSFRSPETHDIWRLTDGTVSHSPIVDVCFALKCIRSVVQKTFNVTLFSYCLFYSWNWNIRGFFEGFAWKLPSFEWNEKKIKTWKFFSSVFA